MQSYSSQGVRSDPPAGGWTTTAKVLLHQTEGMLASGHAGVGCKTLLHSAPSDTDFRCNLSAGRPSSVSTLDMAYRPLSEVTCSITDELMPVTAECLKPPTARFAQHTPVDQRICP
jgi:hypothetical protein